MSKWKLISSIFSFFWLLTSGQGLSIKTLLLSPSLKAAVLFIRGRYYPIGQDIFFSSFLGGFWMVFGISIKSLLLTSHSPTLEQYWFKTRWIVGRFWGESQRFLSSIGLEVVWECTFGDRAVSGSYNQDWCSVTKAHNERRFLPQRTGQVSRQDWQKVGIEAKGTQFRCRYIGI